MVHFAQSWDFIRPDRALPTSCPPLYGAVCAGNRAQEAAQAVEERRADLAVPEAQSEAEAALAGLQRRLFVG